MLLNIMKILNHHVEILDFYILSLSVGVDICKDKHSRWITVTTITKELMINESKISKPFAYFRVS